MCSWVLCVLEFLEKRFKWFSYRQRAETDMYDRLILLIVLYGGSMTQQCGDQHNTSDYPTMNKKLCLWSFPEIPASQPNHKPASQPIWLASTPANRLGNQADPINQPLPSHVCRLWPDLEVYKVMIFERNAIAKS